MITTEDDVLIIEDEDVGSNRINSNMKNMANIRDHRSEMV